MPKVALADQVNWRRRILTRIARPVFYSCDQPKGGAVAESPDRPLLLECSIDMTTRLLPLLLGADFGAKKKVLHVAMPHELMVRYIVYARQHNWRVIYDAQTDWEELARLGGAPWYEVEFEWYVARTANLVSAVSYPLALKLETLAQRGVAVSPNGHDPAFPGPPPVAAQDLPVVGHFAFQPSRSFDWSLLVRSAKHYPGIQFELCGDWTRPSEPLPDNVKLLGSLSWQELAETTSRWKSAILPFRFGPLADSADPIELYEYLHLGLPVLASYLPQLQSYPNTTVTESPEEFVEGIKRVTLSRLQRHDHREWLADQTWERRVEAYRRACPDQTSSPPMADYLLNLGFS